jgi:methylenetetrahydrofolate reductase (NADPH)
MASTLSFARPLAAPEACESATPALRRQQIAGLMADFSIEAMPAVVARHDMQGLLPPATRVYVAFVPGEDWRNLVTAACRLRAAGLTPVPHFPARSIPSEAAFDAFLRQLTEQAGVDQVLVVGGGLDQPQGPFASTLALLETGLLERYGVRTIGIAGHPEGDPPVRSPGAPTSHAQKLAYARQSPAAFRLVTQFAFDADPVLAWERAIRDQGLPIHVGVPGPATLKTLLSYARLCGIGNSIRVLTRQGGNLLRLARISYPDALITALAAARADPACRVERLHVYPFGGLVRTARWLSAVQAGAFTLHDDGLGFTVGDAV